MANSENEGFLSSSLLAPELKSLKTAIEDYDYERALLVAGDMADKLD